MRDLFALFVLAFVRGQRQLKAGCLEPLCCLWLLHSSACPTVRPIVPPFPSSCDSLFIVCLPACIIQQSKKRQLSGEYCFLFALQLPFSIAWRITRKHTHTHTPYREWGMHNKANATKGSPQVQTTNMHPAPQHVLQGKQFSICNLLSSAWLGQFGEMKCKAKQQQQHKEKG